MKGLHVLIAKTWKKGKTKTIFCVKVIPHVGLDGETGKTQN